MMGKRDIPKSLDDLKQLLEDGAGPENLKDAVAWYRQYGKCFGGNTGIVARNAMTMLSEAYIAQLDAAERGCQFDLRFLVYLGFEDVSESHWVKVVNQKTVTVLFFDCDRCPPEVRVGKDESVVLESESHLLSILDGIGFREVDSDGWVTVDPDREFTFPKHFDADGDGNVDVETQRGERHPLHYGYVQPMCHRRWRPRKGVSDGVQPA